MPSRKTESGFRVNISLEKPISGPTRKDTSGQKHKFAMITIALSPLKPKSTIRACPQAKGSSDIADRKEQSPVGEMN